MPYMTNAFMMMTLPWQIGAAFWTQYFNALARSGSAPLPPVAGEASEAAAAGAAAVAKGTRTGPAQSTPA